MSEATSASGTLLKMGDGAPTEAFTTIAEVLDISGPSGTTNMHDVSSHSSGSHVEKLPGLMDEGQITFDINEIKDEGTHDSTTGLEAKRRNRTLTNFQMIDPDGDGVEFSAYVTNFSKSRPVDGPKRASITLEITGALADITP